MIAGKQIQTKVLTRLTGYLTLNVHRGVRFHQEDQMKLRAITRVLSDESGATAIEYGLIAALISVAAIFGLEAVGTTLSGTFEDIDEKLGGSS
jgi:pilus assembly protein Flp/PilA